MTRSRFTRRLLAWSAVPWGVALSLLAVAVVPPVRAQEGGAQSATKAFSASVRDAGGRFQAAVAAASLTILEDGENRDVESSGLLSLGEPRGWDIVVWADPELSTSVEIRGAVGALTDLSTQLTRLGTVSLVVVDGVDEVWLEPTQDSDEVAAAFEELSSTDFWSARSAVPSDPQWRRWHQQMLLATLADRPFSRARALVVVGDLASTEVGTDSDGLARALAAMGWTVLPWVGSGDAQRRWGSDLAAQSGGFVLTSAADVATALDGLASRLWVQFRGRGEMSDAPRPLQVRSTTPGWSVTAPAWTTVATPPAVAPARAEVLLRSGDEGQLALDSALELLSDGLRETEIALDVLVDLQSLSRSAPESSSDLRLTLVLESLDRSPSSLRYRGRGTDLRDARQWLVEAALLVPADLQNIVIVVEDLIGGRWGATQVELDAEPLGLLGSATVSERVDLRPTRIAAGAGDEPASKAPSTIRLLPLETRLATGMQSFRTISLNESVRRVEFLLDGRRVAEDTRAPFGARIDLGPTVRRQTVEVVAYDRGGAELGRDKIDVNPPREPLRVIIDRAERDPSSGELQVSALVTLPVEATLERVDFFWNEDLALTLSRPPFDAELVAPPSVGGTDFLRIAAVLTDGTAVEDVRLFGITGQLEEVEVNLVEVFVVVTDANGDPVRDLQQQDFELRVAGDAVETERFGLAEEVPLGLGLVIDTSASMEPIMQETKAAALQFLTELMSERDRAFVVDFDTKPRLAAAMTRDLPRLFNGLASLDAEGATALYDAIVFSLLNFDGGEDRRALVLLTDGDDYQSRFGVRRAIQQSRAMGVPVYMISLAGLDWMRPAFRKVDLEQVAKQTGGRVFYVDARDQLAATYAKIGAELRSQYVLAFSSATTLSDKALDRVEVRVLRPGLQARAVVAGRLVQ